MSIFTHTKVKNNKHGSPTSLFLPMNITADDPSPFTSSHPLKSRLALPAVGDRKSLNIVGHKRAHGRHRRTVSENILPTVMPTIRVIRPPPTESAEKIGWGDFPIVQQVILEEDQQQKYRKRSTSF